MEQPTYLKRLLNQKILLIIGVFVALIAALLAGFTIKDGEIVSRVEKTYTATTNILLSEPLPTLYQTVIPGETQVVPPADPTGQQIVQQPDTPINLTSSAMLMAYVAQSDEVKDRAAASVGGLQDGESVTAVARTTPPTGNELFPGRLNLPIVQVVGIASSEARALELAGAASTAFGDVVVERQDAEAVPPEIRVTLDILNEPAVGEPDGSNPAIPIVITFVAILLLFVAAALIIEAVRARRAAKKKSAAGTEPEDAVELDESTTDESGADIFDPALLEDSPRYRASTQRRRGSAASARQSTDTVAVLEPDADHTSARD
jgi:hypothetical protein